MIDIGAVEIDEIGERWKTKKIVERQLSRTQVQGVETASRLPQQKLEYVSAEDPLIR